VLLAAPSRAVARDQSSGYYRHGQMSMTAKNYDQAYADFSKALELKPDDAQYQISAQQAQFAAANAHIEAGEKYKAAKQYPEAMVQFQRAMAIDPANFVAQQELRAIDELMHPPAPAEGEPVGAAQVSNLEARLARAAGPVELGPVSNTLIKDFSVNSDPRSAYLSVGKLADLNVIFDSSSQGGYANSGHVSLDLHNVTVMQILQVLNVQTDSFYTPITPNTILIANNNQQKHQAIDQTVLKVFYIKNIEAPTDLTELAQAIRGLTQPQPHIMPVASINALVMRDTPARVAMVQKILDDLDKAPPEVVVDVRILQVNTDVARDLGLEPPTSFSIGLQAPTTPASTTSGSTTSGTATPPTTNSPTLNELLHLNSSNFAVTIPNATLNALLNNSSTHTIQEPELRSVQGQKAQLQIGQRIPVATGSFQPGIGGVGINPLVNTQFTYDPVGVIINMTPEIHGDDSVLLQSHIEISSVDSYNNIGGIQQPVFGNNIIDHTVELKNGQSAVLGSMMVNTLTHNVTGLPGLSSIPVFKFLFSSTHDETVHNEIMVILTPHIVRSLDITAEDQRALDTGTQDNIALRELPPATAAIPASTAAPANANNAAPAAPAIPAPAAAAPAAGGEPALTFAPVAIAAAAGQPFDVQLRLNNARDAYALTFQLNYDPKLMQVQSMRLGGFLSQDGQAPALVHREDDATGTAQVSLSRPPNVAGVAGSGDVVNITFLAKAPGTAPISITRVGARNPQGVATTVSTTPATVTVR
jgi:general secretion pathway protein D